MKFSLIAASALFASVSAYPVVIKRDVPAELIPDFGFSAGRNPTGTGDCDGAVSNANGPIKIPCSCPPDRGDFINKLNANVRAGHATNNPGIAVSFPLGTSKADQLARMQTALVTLQNLNGPGKGCPAVSTTFIAQQKAIADFNGGPPAPAPAAPAPAPPPPAQGGGGAVPDNLIPEFGFSAGRNPTGTGDCDGAVNNANGPIKIPCSCPPDRGDFINKLKANVAAGHATNNPGVAVSFPLGTSKADQLARMQTALVTLQNLNGPGKGCPAVSTTFLAQQKAIADFNAGPAPPAPAPAAPAPPPPPPAAGGGDIVDRLAPDLGFTSGRNPTGTGDCDGAVSNANGPIKIPCSCPPNRADFVAALKANVAAGRPVNNPGVPFSFPTGDSKADQIARIQAGLVTLQNLRGPGQGCPAVSSTLLAQQKALTG